MKIRFAFLSVVFMALSHIPPSWSHQPVMDMAPRWEKGWGVQARHETRFSDKTMQGDSTADNPFGRKRSVKKTWFEGVYTFRREVRVTAKLPYVDQSRTSLVNGVPTKQTGEGFGDLIIGIPLKIYRNEDQATWNMGFTPNLRLPTGSTHGDFPAGDGSTDIGFSLSYSLEKVNLYQFYDVFYWLNNSGTKGIDEGNELGFDSNIGIHPYHDNATNSGVFLMGDLQVRYKERGRDPGGDTGGTRISVGPVFVYYKDNMMFRTEYSFPVYENVSGSQVSYGQELKVGIGFTF